MEWTDLLLIFSNLFMLLAIYASIKEQYFIEGWVLFQSMVVSMTYHALSSYKDSQPKLYSTFQFIDFYCAILVMITLSIFTVKVPEKYKGIPLNILGTFSLFMIFYDDFGIRVELIIAGICFFMVFGIFIFRKKCPEFKKHNLIKGTIFAISGIGCFHITYYTDTIPYWITHTLWHIFIMISDIKKGLNGLANNSISSLAMSNQIMHFISFLIKYFLLHSNLYQLLNYSFYT